MNDIADIRKGIKELQARLNQMNAESNPELIFGSTLYWDDEFELDDCGDVIPSDAILFYFTYPDQHAFDCVRYERGKWTHGTIAEDTPSRGRYKIKQSWETIDPDEYITKMRKHIAWFEHFAFDCDALADQYMEWQPDKQNFVERLHSKADSARYMITATTAIMNKFNECLADADERKVKNGNP